MPIGTASEVDVNYGDIYPKEQVVIKGLQFQIICHSFSTPTWRYHNILRKMEAVRVHAKYVHGNAVLVTNAVEEDHLGIYYCIGDKSTGEKFKVSATVYVGGNCMY